MIDHTKLLDPSPWVPMSKPIDLKHMGKLLEELGECMSAAARCMIQGMEEKDPVTGRPNRLWLEEEMADVYANFALVEEHFQLRHMYERIERKMEHLKRWHQMLDRNEDPDERPNDQ